MKRIKTRETVRNIKTLDKSAVTRQRMRKAFIRNKSATENTAEEHHASPTEYAEAKISSAVSNVASDVVNLGKRSAITIIQFRASEKQKAHEGEIRIEAQDEVFAKRPSPAPQSRCSQTTNTVSPYTHQSNGHISPNSSDIIEQGRTLAKTEFKNDYAENRNIKFREHSIRADEAITQKDIGRVQQAQSRGIKTSLRTARVKIKTQQSAELSNKTPQAAASAAQASRNAARTAAETKKLTAKAAKTVGKAVKAAAKATAAGVKTIATAIAAGGWVAVVVVIIICILGLLFASPFGIFFSGEAESEGVKMCDVVREINSDFEEKISAIKAGTEYDRFEIAGTRTPWKEVLAIYAVQTSTDVLNPQEVVTIDEGKRQLLEETFWSMNVIHHRVRTETKTETVWITDEDGKHVEDIEEVEEKILSVFIDGKTASRMADGLAFSDEQKEQLNSLLDEGFNDMWTMLIYGIHSSDEKIVAVAMSQLGNIGGRPYWSWYGFSSRVEWCACFVSWCANECGYIDEEIIPKFAWCPYGAQWFKDREQWMDNSAEPSPGMIIFFDWDDSDTNGPDGVTDHVSIVERVEDGYVYTIEGNSGDSCRQRKYAVGHYEIYGYGIPTC